MVASAAGAVPWSRSSSSYSARSVRARSLTRSRFREGRARQSSAWPTTNSPDRDRADVVGDRAGIPGEQQPDLFVVVGPQRVAIGPCQHGTGDTLVRGAIERQLRLEASFTHLGVAAERHQQHLDVVTHIASGAASDPAAALNADGRVSVFYNGTDRALWHVDQHDVDYATWDQPRACFRTPSQLS